MVVEMAGEVMEEGCLDSISEGVRKGGEGRQVLVEMKVLWWWWCWWSR